MAARTRLMAVARLVVLLGLVLGSAGCARLFSSYDVAPNGMPRRDDALRRLLVAGRADSALVRVEPEGASAPEDELLRSLYAGILAHYAGQYDSSSVALQRASDLAEDRYTKRISRAALSLVTNDKVLPYDPGEAERLLIHYYAALNYLRRGDTPGAAVEARRLSALLERLEAPRDSAFAGWLRYFSGVIFEAAGEWNDADVAYRNARVLLGAGVMAGASGVDDLSRDGKPGLVKGAGGQTGEVLVLVEEGFVAHRVEQAVVVPLYDFELDRLSGGETSKRLAAAAMVTTRVLAEALVQHGDRSRRYYGDRPRTLHISPLPREIALRECAEDSKKDSGKGSEKKEQTERRDTLKAQSTVPVAGPEAVAGRSGGAMNAARRAGRGAAPSSESSRGSCDLRNPYLLRIAWPVFRQERAPDYSLRVLATSAGGGLKASEPAADSGEVVPVQAPEPMVPPSFQLRADLSDAVARDFDAERGGILARTILRGVTKAAVTRRVEKAPGEDAEGWGRVLGAIINLSTALLEQADTRSWQLLPDRVRLVRLQLPPGEHEVTVEVGGSGGATRRIELGSVRVRAGELSILSARDWK